tara:strand:+ start:62 stop:709 length:648 start_codon:yes stop_codon:yes gene_type:complete
MSDIIGGITVGIFQIIFGHPLDTIKVRIQNSQVWRGLNWKMYYNGYRYPCMSTLFYNALAFPIYERSLEYTDSHLLSGFLAGSITTPGIFLLDIGKIKEQTHNKIKLKDFTNTKGFYSTFWRESISSAVYFGGYHYCKNSLEYSILLSGGIAGLLNWTITYPIDVIRTRQIAQNITIKQSINQRYLWKGYIPCAIRAVLVNSISFYIYEFVKKNI